MKLPPLTRQQVREVDQIALEEYAMSGIVLMENAGRGAAERIAELAPPGPILILCGAGNNGGDGYVIARHLQLAGREVSIVSLVDLEKLSGDARTNAEIANLAEISIAIAESADQIATAIAGAAMFAGRGTIVDCLLGTGASGAPRGRFADAVAMANQTDALRIAIDIPTGLDCDTGVAGEPTFQADHTISFIAAKVGFTKKNAEQYVGVVHEIGIGVPRKLLNERLAPSSP